MNVCMNPLFTTSYVDPDLDGVACAIAYAELLNATGVTATACVMGHPTVEAEFALSTLGVARPIQRESFLPIERVIILDASEPIHFEGRLVPEQVIEVIDHRQVNEAHLFSNAKVQIEFVGAAATLVAERFLKQDHVPSVKSAQLLQAAIISNTQHFQANTTTDRDSAMMQWLHEMAPLPDAFVQDMFAAKSDFTGEKLAHAMDIETAIFEMGDKRIGIVQLEMIGSDALVRDRRNELLQILESFRQQNNLDHIFLTILDIEAKLNRFVTVDRIMQSVLTEVLGVTFVENVGVRDGIIMRKEIVPLIKKSVVGPVTSFANDVT